jgi:hypothetical protein
MPVGEPKETGRDEGEPKETGRDEGEPKETGRGAGGPFVAGGGGLVVVSFIGQTCMNVSDLACRMLGGGSRSEASTGLQLGPLVEAAVLAQEKARKQARVREEERQLAERYRQLIKPVERPKSS